jgi:uncharacterized protein YcaQ
VRPAPQRVPRERLARIAVAAAGLHRRAPFGRGRPGARRALEHLGYAQIDTISVVRRAHEHVLRSRAPAVGPDHLNDLLRRREAFEYWAHAAAYLPMRDWRHCLPRMRRLQAGDRFWFERDPRTMDRVRDRIRAEGPLGTSDFEGAVTLRVPGWAGWKPAKAALERLFHEGELMVVARTGFEKIYDLTERVLPVDVDTRCPTIDEHAAHLVDRARSTLGVFAPKHVTHLRREPGLREAVRARLDALEAEGAVRRVAVAAGGPWYADAAALDDPPRVTGDLRALSPFDPLVIHRDRLTQLFGFDYQLECYVPEAKRRWGYFALPLLDGARFLGRADCRADRARGVFTVRHLSLDDAADLDALLARLPDALAPLMAADDCHRVRLERASGVPRSALPALRRALADAEPRPTEERP